MSRPEHAGYDPFDSPRPGQGQGFSHGQGGPGYQGGPGFQGGQGFGGGPGYEGYYAAGSGNPHQGPGGQPAVSTGKGMAITALVLGLLSVPSGFMVIGGLLAIAAIIFAFVALRAGSKARKLGSTQTGGTTAMSIIGIISAILGLVIAGFVLWGAMLGAGAVAECEHLINDQAAFDACVQDSVLGRLGLN